MGRVKDSMDKWDQYLHLLKNGWYWSDETEDLHGPFQDKENAKRELIRYAEQLERPNG